MNSNNDYYAGMNLQLAQCVVPTEETILEVGCGEGRLGHYLKQLNPQRTVYGIELVAEVAELARQQLDKVFNIDVLDIDSVLYGQQFDLILAGDVLEHLVDPEAALVALRAHLNPGGRILACIPNIQHISMVHALVSGNWNYRDKGLLDRTHLRFFSRSSFMKLCMDVDLEPFHIEDTGAPLNPTGNAIEMLARMFPGLHPKQLLSRLAAYQMIFQMTLPAKTEISLPDHSATNANDVKISFIVCVNNEGIFSENFALSPCVQSGDHQVIKISGAESAAAGLARGTAVADNELIAFVHQDVYLPLDWDKKVIKQYQYLLREKSNLGAFGVYGVDNYSVDGESTLCGRVVDTNQCIYQESQLPHEVDSLDEIVVMFRKSSGLGFDPALGFHLYGSDICLQARENGLRNFVILAPCYHATQTVDLDENFHHSSEVFRRKWTGIMPGPYQTSCILFE